MATRRFVFGKPPFRLLADHLAQDRDFVEDAQRILKLDEDGYLRLATQLAKADTFLSRSDLTVIVAEALGEDADEIAAIIHRLSGIVRCGIRHRRRGCAGHAIKEKATSLNRNSANTGRPAQTGGANRDCETQGSAVGEPSGHSLTTFELSATFVHFNRVLSESRGLSPWRFCGWNIATRMVSPALLNCTLLRDNCRNWRRGSQTPVLN